DAAAPTLTAHPSPPSPAGATAHASIGYEPIPPALAADSFGHLYMTNVQWMSSIYRYSDDGSLLARWGHFEVTSGFVGRGIATDAAGDLWVADEAGGKVVEFGPDGSMLRSWDATGDGAIAIGPKGDVYLLNHYEVEHFTPDGTLIAKWGLKDGLGGKFAESYGIATGPDGDVYVAETWGDRVDVFDSEGAFLRSFGSGGYGPGQFSTPYGIAVAPTSGDVYVADTGDDRVVEFSAEGAFIRTWGKAGPRAGEFYTPTAVAVDPAGYVYVADAGEEYPDDGYARVQKFTGAGKFVAQWGEVPALRPKLTHRTMKNGDAVFRFTSGQKGAGFECRLHGHGVPKKLRRWNQPCSSPKRYVHLAPGKKVFEVWTVLGHQTSATPFGRRTSGATRYTWDVPATRR
ncbi:MAG: NHL repeat-containing protein, partial [Actinobacteria bacterium]|nr:NHL repeat-containing protein [Actinomycetota bacterium]